MEMEREKNRFMITLIVNTFMNFFNVSISELRKEAVKIQFYVN